MQTDREWADANVVAQTGLALDAAGVGAIAAVRARSLSETTSGIVKG